MPFPTDADAAVIAMKPTRQPPLKLSVLERVTYIVGLIVAYAALGFITGFHWFVLKSYTTRVSRGADPYVAIREPTKQSTCNRWSHVLHSGSYWGAALVLGLGGGWARSGTYTRCFGNETMSHACLYTEQTMAYQIIYSLHFMGLSWMICHWIVDGLNLPTILIQICFSAKPTILYGRSDIASGYHWVLCVVTSAIVVLSWTVLVPAWSTSNIRPLVNCITIALITIIVAFVATLKLKERCFRKPTRTTIKVHTEDENINSDDATLITA
eukprot:m.137743 g.137743  ORF g.137743 m.137743 type:complete len:269 (+) comp29941_c0_seq1:269-1075(+)